MKKKLKLFVSILCLCLTLGIGIFGVYSAMQITYTVSGSVKYEVKGALVEITTKIYAYNERTNLDSGTQKMNELKALSHDDINLDVATDESGNEYVDTFKSFTDDLIYDESKQEGIFDEIVLDFNKSLTYYIVVNIKVYNNDSGVDASVTAENFNIANTWHSKTENLTQILSSHKDGKNIVFACGVADVASNAEGTFNYTITFEKKDIEQINGVSNYYLNSTQQVNDNNKQTVTISSKDANSTKNIPMHILNFTIDNTNEVNKANTFKVNLSNVKINGVNATEDQLKKIGIYSTFREVTANPDTYQSYTKEKVGFYGDEVYLTNGENEISFAILNTLNANSITFEFETTITKVDVSDLLTYTYDSTLGGYTVAQNNTWLDSHNITNYVLEIPATYNGSNGVKNVVKVADKAFYYNTNTKKSISPIQQIILPDTIIEIGQVAFATPNAEISVNIPSKVEKIGKQGLAYNGYEGEIVIPKTIESFGDMALVYSKFKKVVVEDGLTSIPYGCFGYCSNLTEIQVPDTVLTIGGNVFQNCEKLKKFKFPANIQIIETAIFYDAISLRSVILPQTEKEIEIETSAFHGSGLSGEFYLPNNYTLMGNSNGQFTESNISSFKVDPDNNKYMTINGVLYKRKNSNSASPDYNVPEVLEAYPSASPNKTFELKASVTTLRRYELESAKYLQYYVVEQGNPNFASEDGMLYTADKESILSIPKGRKISSYVVKEGVKYVGFPKCYKFKES